MRTLSNTIKGKAIKGLLAFCLLFNFSAMAQQSALNFDSRLHECQGFNGGSFSFDKDPLDTTNNVGRVDNIGGIWEGVGITFPQAVCLDSSKIVTLKVYQSTNATTTVILRMVDAVAADVEVEQSFTGIGWSTVTLDYSQARISGTNTPINAEGNFSVAGLLINGGNNTIGTYYIDDLTFPNYESANSLDVIYTDLVYEDEFNYNGSIDTSAWFPEEVPPIPGTGWFNNEEQHYTSRTDNVFASNGTLKIKAKKETYNAYGLTKNYTSARLNSKYYFQYGRIDVRAKLPEGDGTWPAIWMLGTSYGNNWTPKTQAWPDCGEIDVMEHWGNDADKIHGSLHSLSSNGATVNTQTILDEDVFDQWHVYSMNWSPNQISFLMDGFLYYTYNPSVKDATTWPFDDPQFILLNVAMGGIFPIDPNFVESTMEIDYVRVYQNVNIGIEEENKPIDISVYPNPTSDFVKVNTADSGIFKVYDVLGKLLVSKEIIHSGITEISLPELPQGIYIWNFEAEQKSASGRLQIVN